MPAQSRAHVLLVKLVKLVKPAQSVLRTGVLTEAGISMEGFFGISSQKVCGARVQGYSSPFHKYQTRPVNRGRLASREL